VISTRQDQPPSPPGKTARRGAALYMLVVTISLLVSVTGLAGVSLIRLQRDEMSTALEVQRARRLARSAVELAQDKLMTASNWRTSYASGVETTPFTPTGFSGSISWRVSDSDGSFSNGDTLLRLDGIGRIGQTTQVISCLFSDNSTVGPTELRSYSSWSYSEDDVQAGKWWGQYTKPTFPASATMYRVTSVRIYCRRQDSNRWFSVSTYLPNGANMPSTLIDTYAINSDWISTSSNWITVPMSESQWLSTTQGICVTVTTTGWGTPIRLRYRGGSVYDSNSAMLGGSSSSGWTSYQTDKAIFYRIDGEYRTSPANITITPGSLYWGAAP